MLISNKQALQIAPISKSKIYKRKRINKPTKHFLVGSSSDDKSYLFNKLYHCVTRETKLQGISFN